MLEALKRPPEPAGAAEGKRPHLDLKSGTTISAHSIALAAAKAAAADAAAMPPPNVLPTGASVLRADELTASMVGALPPDLALHDASSSGSLSTSSAPDELPSPWLTASGSSMSVFPSPALLPSGATATLVVGMSPALLPSTAGSIELAELPEAARSAEQHFFPLDSAARKPFGSPAGAPSSPAEGGIMMLSDLQEYQASRKTLDSALRDYGVSLVGGCSSAHRLGRSPLGQSHQSSLLACSQSSILSQLGLEGASAPGPSAASLVPVPAPDGSLLLDIDGIVESAPHWLCTSLGEDSDDADGVFSLSNGLRAPATSAHVFDESLTGSIQPSETAPTEGMVRLAVVTEMASAGLTQYSVAQQAGLSQPALCEWLSGKTCNSPGKEPGELVTKLAVWLHSRGKSGLHRRPLDPPLASLKGRTTPLLFQTPAASTAFSTAPPTLVPAPSAVRRGKRKEAPDDVLVDPTVPRAGCSPCEDVVPAHMSSAGAEGRSRGGGRMRLTEQHLYVAYVWYLNEREHQGRGGAGEEEHFCFKCKDGGDVMLCDFNDGGCSKSYHVRCCNLKAVPEGHWECPRHKCGKCGASPPRGAPKLDETSKSEVAPHVADATQGRAKRVPGRGQYEGTIHLWPCRTCPETFCGRCVPEGVLHAGAEIICLACQELLRSDLSHLQRDLLICDPDQFAQRAGRH